MSGDETEPTQPSPPSVWWSLIVAALLAVSLPLQWIAYRERGDLLQLRFLLAPIYVPLAFGVIWPALVILQTAVTPRAQRVRSHRHTVAIPMFILSLLASSPFVVYEVKDAAASAAQARAASQRDADAFRRGTMDEAHARTIVRAKGLLAFSDPLTVAQSKALDDAIDSATVSPDELLQVARQYRTSVYFLSLLAYKKWCPPAPLAAVFDDASRMQRDSAGRVSSDLEQLYKRIAQHPNVPVPVLAQMLDNPSEVVRLDAARIPRLPLEFKIGYLHKVGASGSPTERNYAAADSDTPPDVLTRLAADSIFAYLLSDNLKTPTAVLRALAQSGDVWTRTRARANLAKRGESQLP